MEDDEESAPYLNLVDARLVGKFMNACPPKGYVTPIPKEIVHVMPMLRKFIKAHPAVLKKNVRRVLLQLILDMAVDNIISDQFIEFGAFVLDRCAVEGVAQFFNRFNEDSYLNFFKNELCNYSITGSDHATFLLRDGLRRVWCSNNNCPNEGDYRCGRCLRKLGISVFYCSKKCQTEHYPSHRPHCGRTQNQGDNLCLCKIREEYMERLQKKYVLKGKENKKKTKPTISKANPFWKEEAKWGHNIVNCGSGTTSATGGGGGVCSDCGAQSNKKGEPSSPGKVPLKRGFFG